MSLSGPTVVASGGDTVQDIGGYRIHTFTTVGTSSFTVDRGGLVDVLVVGGGGGGGGSISNQSAGGGGAGELIYKSSHLTDAGNHTVVIGAGGVGGSTQPANGGSSSFGTLVAVGGGGGGYGTSTFTKTGKSGGSSGGNARGITTIVASINTIGLGNEGGKSTGGFGGGASAGGGGGALSPGSDSVSDSIRSPGGIGYTTNITGTVQIYAAGGEGGARTATLNGDSAVANTGSGGGGGDGQYATGGTTNGGAGGSGIVIVRYQLGMFLGPATGVMRGIFTYNYPLDTASSVIGAYSLRKLIGSYQGPMIRLRRQSDLSLMDFVGDNFGKLSNIQTVQTVSEWIGASSANVLTWYDQSSVANHASYITDNVYGLPPPFSLTDGIFFPNQNFTTSTTYYYGLKLGTSKATQACLCNFKLISGKINDVNWNSLVASNRDNSGVRLVGNPGALNIGDGNDFLTTRCYTIFDGKYNSPTSGTFFTNSFNSYHKMFANRTVGQFRDNMLYIGTPNPSISDTLRRRATYGYMNELVLFSGSVSPKDAIIYLV